MRKITMLSLLLLCAYGNANSDHTSNSLKFKEKKMQNIGSYFEIPVVDLDRAMKFYSSVFTVEFTKEQVHGNEMALFPFNGESSGITGALAKGDIYKPSTSGSLIYLSTNNIDNTLEKVKSQGGEVLFPKTSAGEYGYVAEFKDLEGNRVALFESK